MVSVMVSNVLLSLVSRLCFKGSDGTSVIIPLANRLGSGFCVFLTSEIGRTSLRLRAMPELRLFIVTVCECREE